MPEITQEMRHCIQECQDCHAMCLETVTYCLQQGGRHAEREHIRLMLDCVEICQTSANFMLRGSDLHTYTCGVAPRCVSDALRTASVWPTTRGCGSAGKCAAAVRNPAGGWPAVGPRPWRPDDGARGSRGRILPHPAPGLIVSWPSR